MKRTPVTDVWPREMRIIEFGLRDGSIGERLLANGYGRYLAVAANDAERTRLAGRHPRLAPCLTQRQPRDGVRANNADVLVLDGTAAARLLRFRNVRHAAFVALQARFTPTLLWAMLFGVVQYVLGRLAWPRIVWLGGDRRAMPLVVYRVRRRRPYDGVRRFVPHRLGLNGFFRQLRGEGVRHAVLRWFESLPQLPAGEDLDILVDDERLPAVRDLLDSGPGLQPVDLYSAYGAPGADYRQLPYYPPYLAEQLLERAIIHNDLCAVPSPRDHFLSLAYHAMYHKGAASGLPGHRRRWWRSRPEHDYAGILERLARHLDIDVPITLEGLDAYLDSQGWRPPHDMLVRLARKNTWLRTLLKRAPHTDADDGLAVFLLRREALTRGGTRRAAKLLAEHGFQVPEIVLLDPRRAQIVARSVRGGNWGAGPWPLSGGPPVAALVAYDPQPVSLTRRQKKRFPFLGNARLLAKDEIRDAFNADLPPERHCNVIHSSDNGREALDYLRIIAPERADDILARLRTPQRLAA